jgi:hypothetical protein
MCRPLLRVGQGRVEVVLVVQVWDHGEVDQSGSLSRDQDSVDVALGRGEDDVLRLQRSIGPAPPIGLPSSSTSASWMLAFLMPPEVRRSLITPFLGCPASTPPPNSQSGSSESPLC